MSINCNEPTILRFEILVTMTVKYAIFWDVTPCGQSQVYRRFGGMHWLQTTTDTTNNTIQHIVGKVGKLLPLLPHYKTRDNVVTVVAIRLFSTI